MWSWNVWFPLEDRQYKEIQLQAICKQQHSNKEIKILSCNSLTPVIFTKTALGKVNHVARIRLRFQRYYSPLYKPCPKRDHSKYYLVILDERQTTSSKWLKMNTLSLNVGYQTSWTVKQELNNLTLQWLHSSHYRFLILKWATLKFKFFLRERMICLWKKMFLSLITCKQIMLTSKPE